MAWNASSSKSRLSVEPADYLLCASTSHPHKNLDRLLRVHAAMKDAPPLVLAGVRGFAAKGIERLAGRSVRLLGWIPRDQFYELFRRARGFIYPSTFEGFGMPVSEAMAAGVPVACSDIPPLREIGGDTVHYFDPSSDEAVRGCDRALVRGINPHAECAAPGVRIHLGKMRPRYVGLPQRSLRVESWRRFSNRDTSR